METRDNGNGNGGRNGLLPLFVGYCTLEEWLHQADATRPVFAMPLIEPGAAQDGLQVDELVVVCQQVASDLTIRYCRLRAASLTRCYGQPFDEDWQEREMAWKSLWECVKAILQEAGLTHHKATVARPKGIVLLEGRCEQVAYDQHERQFVRKGEQQQ